MRCCGCASAVPIPSGWPASWRGRRVCKPFEVGFAGLKDRNAVTTQSFTVPRGKRAAEEFVGISGEGLRSNFRSRRINANCRAAHWRRNRFVITVRGLAWRCAGARRAPRTASATAACLTISVRSASVARRETSSRCCVQRRRRVRGGAPRCTRSRGLHVVGGAQRHFQRHAGRAGRTGQLEPAVGGRCREPRRPGQRFRGRIARRCACSDAVPRSRFIPPRRWSGAGESLASGDVLALEEEVTARFPEAVAVIRAEAHERGTARDCGSACASSSMSMHGDMLRLQFALSAGSFATTVLREIIATSDNGE